MKNKRIYNIIFHTHTVSGIVISVALYVIFFAGSFSFFRDEIVSWEKGHQVGQIDEIQLSLDTLVQNLSDTIELQGRYITLSHYYNERRVDVSISESKDTTIAKTADPGSFFYYDTKDQTTTSYNDSYTLGEFLYRLHFFAQIPYPVGYYLSGLVAFFFLFAILTGIIIHWDKIISNFYVFRPWAKLKTIWTDAHTALGVIGLPFQFVYAVTGSFFMLKAIIIAPFLLALYGGDEAKLYEELEFAEDHVAYLYTPIETTFALDGFTKQVSDKWKDFKVTDIHISSYGDKNMQIKYAGHLDYAQKLNGVGSITFNVASKEIVSERSPIPSNSYLDVVKNILYRLHLGDYAGIGLRVISFILGLISCFVIISGVLIWVVARDKKNVAPKTRKFNNNVGYWYMAICLSMYPIIALSFILVKAFPPAGMSFLYKTFFIGWLLLSTLFALKKDNHLTTKYALILGALLGFMIPVINGIMSGNWIWLSFSRGNYDILLVDLLWITLSSISVFALYKMRGSNQYKSIKT